MTYATLAVWFVAVLALNAITGMMYFELDPWSRISLAAWRPWVWASMVGFVVLGALGWWMGSRWWRSLLVASTGIVGLIQLGQYDNGPVLAIPFLLLSLGGAVAAVLTARPFARRPGPG